MSRTNQEPEYRRRIREKTEKDKHEAANEKRETAERADIRKVVSAIDAIYQQYKSESHKDNARKKRDRFWEIMGVVGLWLAAGVGATAILVGTHDAEMQRGVTQRQLETMQDTFAATERPWVSIDSVKPTGVLAFLKNGNIATLLSFVLSNSGRTPALHVFPWIKPILMTSGSVYQIITKIVEYCEEQRLAKFSQAEGGILLPPNKPHPFSIGIQINSSDIQAGTLTVRGRKAINPYIAGCINYEFTFGPRERHQTGFVYQFGGPETWVFLDKRKEIPAEKLWLVDMNGAWAD